MSVSVMERPIQFTRLDMEALLSGQKTVARRAVHFSTVLRFDEPRSQADVDAGYPFIDTVGGYVPAVQLCPYGQPGDRVWVREAFGSQVRRDAAGGTGRFAVYRASKPDAVDYVTASGKQHPVKWKPCTHMPRHLSRFVLEITAVRLERLHDITPEQALAEGVKGCELSLDPDGNGYSPYELFSALWVSINGMKSWVANPWVWVIEFKKVQP